MDKLAVDNFRGTVTTLTIQTDRRSAVHWLGLALTLVVIMGASAESARAQQTAFNVNSPDDRMAEDLRDASETVRLTQSGGAGAQDVLAAARSDYARLINALYRNGYYGGIIEIAIDGRPIGSLSPFAAPTAISAVQIEITPGRQFSFGETILAPLPPGTDLPGGFEAGAPAFSGTVRDATKSAIQAWREDGYALTTIERQQISANHPISRLDVDIRLNPGKRLSFGELVVNGNERTTASRVREIAGLPTGAVFSPQLIETAADRLRRTGAFSSVSLRELSPDPKQDTLDVAVQLTESPLRRLGAGVEIASDEGLRLSGFWLHRNLLGGAERLRFDAEIAEIGGTQSGLDYKLAGSFRRPGTFAPGTDLVARTELERDDGVTALGDRFLAYLGAERQISRDITAEIGLEFLAEEIERRPGRGSLRILSLPAIVGFDTRDDALTPTDGVLAQLELRPYAGMGDAGHGFRAYTDLRTYKTIGSRVVLAGRLQAGAVFGSRLQETPSDYLFLSGGSGTVRGQPFESLGTSASGSFTGGRSFFGGSIEARVGVTDAIGIVAFYDRAFVGADSLPFANGAAHSGYGFGARYKTAIGALRLDVGFPAGGRTRPKLYLGIGQAF